MKYEQVTVDYWVMLKSSFTYLALIFSAWILLKLIMAVFWLPAYLDKYEAKSKRMLGDLCDKLNINLAEEEELLKKEEQEQNISAEAKAATNEETALGVATTSDQTIDNDGIETNKKDN